MGCRGDEMEVAHGQVSLLAPAGRGGINIHGRGGGGWVVGVE